MSEDDWQRLVLGEVGGHTSAAADPSPASTTGNHQPVDGDSWAQQQPPSPGHVTSPRPPITPAARALPLQPPALVPALPSEAEALVTGKPRKGDSAGRRIVRGLRRLVASSTARESGEVTRVARELQQPITTGRQIVVTSVRGGAGKTTVAALLASAYAHHRPDPVLVMEANPTLGTLPVRVGAPSLRWTMSDVARVVTPSMRFDQVIGYLVGLPEGGWMLPGSKGQIGAQVSLEEYRDVAVALRRYFAITVVDCESLPGELARSAMAGAQARVLVTPATVDGVASTRSVLEWMGSLPRPMLPQTVVALAETAPHTAIDLAAAARYVQVGDVRVVRLPYDRQLAGGGAIRLSLLGEATREAVARLGAELLNRAVGGHGRRV
jgi:MinD-like ATPase involved in chromosome partitioning or flagellar assembly